MAFEQIEALEHRIRARREADPEESYVASLYAKGRKKIAQKVAEEGAELAIAAVSEGREAIIAESADLLMHMLVLLADAGLRLEDVCEELSRRSGVSGLEEKASR